jgi:cytochrome c
MSKIFDLVWSLILSATIFFSIPGFADDEISKGKQLFQTKCAMCHTHIQGTSHSTGPNLFGVVGRNVGSANGFNYSEAMAERANEIWNFEMIDKFINHPQKFIPRSAMIFIGITDVTQRKQLIEYLDTLKIKAQ